MDPTPGMQVCGWDTETHLIGAGDIAPRMVCSTYDLADEGQITPTTNPKDTFRTAISSNGDLGDAGILPGLLAMWQDAYARRSHIVIQNATFDICVGMRYCQDVINGVQPGDPKQAAELYRLMWEVLEQGLEDELNGIAHFVHDTIIREKLWNLGTTGAIEGVGGRDIRYSLDALVKTYFDIDISDSKVTTDQSGRIFNHLGQDITGTAAAASSWRLRYSQLDGVPSSQWPPEAREYAISDATWARKVFECQEGNRRPSGPGSMNSESLQVYSDVALRIYSMPGFRVDVSQVERIRSSVDTHINKANEYLKLNGIVRADGSVNTKILAARIEAAWKVRGRFPRLTDTGKISSSAEALEELTGADPLLDLYADRQTYVKIQSSFLPNLVRGQVWSNYDVLKETGRTSSYGNSEKGKRKPLYEAVNIQQIPKMDGVRECFLPPAPAIIIPGEQPIEYVICSADYSALELCSVAQVTYSLLGYSTHRDRINQGYDLHTYLGASMARALDPETVDHATDVDAAYRALNAKRKIKVADSEAGPEADQRRKVKKAAVTWRNFAKPVGLGYPGGLGPATLVTFAKATYGVTMDEDQANAFRDLWRLTYPEMPDYFKWVDRQTDPQWGSSDVYCYETQGYNRFRAGSTFCATANGKAMQSLSADGAKRSTCWLARACSGGLDPSSPYSLLSDCVPLAFIHDENLIAIPVDELMTERALLVSQLMVEAMKVSMPDVLLKAEPALMRRWIKAAEPEWADDALRPNRVLEALDRRGFANGVRNFADAVADALPGYDPTKRLVPWDDVYRKQVA